ncbi:AI-2E family transporter [Clostridium sp. SYSU_GA19001]|uniref:AI-2E family transporter n=1 Tax=Clostridium caldaquaticum TaxID=2940653 RepID=UPI0020776F73|nr:AI-2E family transporter [Clostridium caldaquaticum]MCM8710458.1 AI-2E family transporter [Clostridium caldaquaticum]
MKKIYRYLLVLIILFTIIYISLKSPILKEVYYLIFISFIIAYSIRPLIKILVEKGISRKLSAVLVLVIFIVLFLGTFVIIIPSIFKESLYISNTFGKIQTIIDGLYLKIKPLSNNKTIYAILDTLYSNSNKMIIDLFNKILSGAFSLGENMLSLAVIPILVYYFLADSEIIANRMIMFFPANFRCIIKKIVEDIDKMLGRYIISQFILCAIIGICTFIVLIILKVDFPILLSLLNALFNIIPYFGPLFGAIPAILVALLSSVKTAIWTAVCLYFIQQVEGDIISPKITGDSINMHPLLVIILLLIGSKVGGFLGMVLAVPIGVIIKILYEDFNYYLF